MQLGLLHEIDVERLEPEVPATAVDLVQQERRAQAAAADHRLGVDQAAADVGVVELPLRVADCEGLGVESELSALGYDDELISGYDTLGDGASQRAPHRALAREAAIGERRVQDVDAPLETLGDGRAIEEIFDASGPAAARAECQG